MELSREERWVLIKKIHNDNAWTLPWDRMVLPAHEWFDQYTEAYNTRIKFRTPKTTEECTDDELKELERFWQYKNEKYSRCN